MRTLSACTYLLMEWNGHMEVKLLPWLPQSAHLHITEYLREVHYDYLQSSITLKFYLLKKGPMCTVKNLIICSNLIKGTTVDLFFFP